MAAECSVQNMALRELAPRSGDCDWPRLVIPAKVASTKVP